MQNSESYRTKYYNAALTLPGKVKSAAAAAGRPLCEVLMTQFLVPGFQEMLLMQESIVTAMRTSYRTKKDNEKAARTCLGHLHSQLSTAVGARFSENTTEPSPFTPTASLQASYPVFFCSASLRRSTRLRPQIPAPIVEVLSGEYNEAQEIRRAIMGQFDGESEEISLLTKKKRAIRKEHRKARAQASALKGSLPLPSASQVDVFGKYRLREKLEAVPRSVLKSYFQLLHMDTSDKESSSYSGSGNDERSLSL